MISIINQVLALCGMVTIRGFPTVFVYFLTMRLTLAWPDRAPEVLLQMAEQTHSFWMSPIVLTFLGILAVLEIAAMRNPDIKEFLVKDLDRYTKPLISILLVFEVVPPEQIQEVNEMMDGVAMVQAASFGGFTFAMMALAGFTTWFLCQIRSATLETIQMIDPENDLKLQSLSNYLGEIALVAIFFSMIFLPVLALLLTVIGMLTGLLFKHLWTRYERNHSHPCAACAAAGRETTVSDCALICPGCGAEQSDVRRVGWFGFSGSRPLEGMSQEKHAFRLLAAHRCRWCASPLSKSTVCSRCEREQWTDEMQAFYVRQTDLRGGLLLLLALLFFWFPFGGLVIVLVLFRPFVIRPLSTHLSASDRFLTALVMMFLKLLILVPMVILSTFFGVGLLVLLPFIGRYLFVRTKFLRMLEHAKEKR